MRVQPHLPSKPLLTIVMSRSGSAFCACSAANSPAPPAPRIKMSVLKCSTSMGASEYAREEDEGDNGRNRGSERRQLLLAAGPREILDHQDAQAAEQMNREQKHQRAFGGLDQRLIAPAQKAFKLRLAVDGKAERQEVQRQEDRQRPTGKPVYHGGDPQRAAAMLYDAHAHDSTTAATARSPSTSSSSPKPMA